MCFSNIRDAYNVYKAYYSDEEALRKAEQWTGFSHDQDEKADRKELAAIRAEIERSDWARKAKEEYEARVEASRLNAEKQINELAKRPVLVPA